MRLDADPGRAMTSVGEGSSGKDGMAPAQEGGTVDAQEQHSSGQEVGGKAPKLAKQGVTTSSKRKPPPPAPLVTPANGTVESQPPFIPPPDKRRRFTNQLRYLQEVVLTAVWSNPFAGPFQQPMDVVGMNLKDYYKVISRPMDLGTIKKRLENGYYEGAKECLEDFQLVFNNSYTYHQSDPAAVEVVVAKSLEKIFKEKLAGMPKEELEIENPGVQTVAADKNKISLVVVGDSGTKLKVRAKESLVVTSSKKPAPSKKNDSAPRKVRNPSGNSAKVLKPAASKAETKSTQHRSGPHTKKSKKDLNVVAPSSHAIKKGKKGPSKKSLKADNLPSAKKKAAPPKRSSSSKGVGAIALPLSGVTMDQLQERFNSLTRELRLASEKCERDLAAHRKLEKRMNKTRKKRRGSALSHSVTKKHKKGSVLKKSKGKENAKKKTSTGKSARKKPVTPATSTGVKWTRAIIIAPPKVVSKPPDIKKKPKRGANSQEEEANAEPMSFQEKLKLVQEIRELYNKNVETARLVAIIQKREPEMWTWEEGKAHEMLDWNFGVMKPSTLRALEAHVIFCHRKMSGTTNKKKSAPSVPANDEQVEKKDKPEKGSPVAGQAPSSTEKVKKKKAGEGKEDRTCRLSDSSSSSSSDSGASSSSSGSSTSDSSDSEAENTTPKKRKPLKKGKSSKKGSMNKVVPSSTPLNKSQLSQAVSKPAVIGKNQNGSSGELVLSSPEASPKSNSGVDQNGANDDVLQILQSMRMQPLIQPIHSPCRGIPAPSPLLQKVNDILQRKEEKLPVVTPERAKLRLEAQEQRRQMAAKAAAVDDHIHAELLAMFEGSSF